jgi:hypothetical protein
MLQNLSEEIRECLRRAEEPLLGGPPQLLTDGTDCTRFEALRPGRSGNLSRNESATKFQGLRASLL